MLKHFLHKREDVCCLDFQHSPRLLGTVVARASRDPSNEKQHSMRGDVISLQKMSGGTTTSAVESCESTQPSLQPKRRASLPMVNLVTAQQVEVDLLVDLPASFYPEHDREDIPDSPSHPPWPHSPSASSLVTPLSATGLYIVLE